MDLPTKDLKAKLKTASETEAAAIRLELSHRRAAQRKGKPKKTRTHKPSALDDQIREDTFMRKAGEDVPSVKDLVKKRGRK